MKFTHEFKENVVKKVLSGQSVKKVASEIGASEASIYHWIKQYQRGTMKTNERGPRTLSLSQKQDLLLEAQAIDPHENGEWLRKNGLRSEHLEKWKKEIANAMNKNTDEKNENKKLREENNALKKELVRKDKALAEAAALLTLKKKYQYLWEGEEK